MLVLLSLRTQYTNLGDQMINAQLVSRLAPDHELCCFTRGVPQWYCDEFKAAIGGAAERATFTSSLIGLAMVILRGVFKRRTICMFLSPGAVLPQQRLGVQRLVQLALLVIVPRMRLAQVGASYEGLDSHGARLLRWALARSHHLTVRDELSRDLLAGRGLIIPLVPDLAFGLARRRSSGRRFVMSFRASSRQQIEALAARLMPLIAAARDAGLEPCFYWQVLVDRQTSEDLAHRTGAPVMRAASERPTLDEALDFYGEAAVICSNRLHGLLIASAAGAVPFALLDAKEVKVTGAFRTAGLGDFISMMPERDLPVFRETCLAAPAQDSVDAAFQAEQQKLAAYFASVARVGP